MREIKFRAWDKKRKCMFQVTEMNFRGSGKVYSVSPNQGDDFYLVGDEVEIMQYAGQKDVNGVEIYEGDIVEFTIERFKSDDYKIKRGKVVYEDGGFKIYTDSKKHNKKMELIGYLIKYFGIEVIGNIFENQELLGDNNERV